MLAEDGSLMVHYFEEEAVKSYTSYLQMVDEGLVENVKAPRLAIDYYGLADDARLSDLIRCVRARAAPFFDQSRTLPTLWLRALQVGAQGSAKHRPNSLAKRPNKTSRNERCCLKRRLRELV